MVLESRPQNIVELRASEKSEGRAGETSLLWSIPEEATRNLVGLTVSLDDMEAEGGGVEGGKEGGPSITRSPPEELAAAVVLADGEPRCSGGFSVVAAKGEDEDGAGNRDEDRGAVNATTRQRCLPTAFFIGVSKCGEWFRCTVV